MRAETTLHAALKDFYTLPGSSQEVLVDGYWIDVVQGDLLVEIQTGNFSALKPKLNDLLDRHTVRLVHPIAYEKWIVRLPAVGDTPVSRRKSPRRGRLEDIFWELIRLPGLLAHPNFSLEVLLTREEEHRRDDGKGSWRRGGQSIADRVLLEVVDRRLFQTPSNLLALLPSGLSQPFTNEQLSKALGIRLKLATRMVYCFRGSGLVEIEGKKGRKHLYRIIQSEAS